MYLVYLKYFSVQIFAVNLKYKMRYHGNTYDW